MAKKVGRPKKPEGEELIVRSVGAQKETWDLAGEIGKDKMGKRNASAGFRIAVHAYREDVVYRKLPNGEFEPM